MFIYVTNTVQLNLILLEASHPKEKSVKFQFSATIYKQTNAQLSWICARTKPYVRVISLQKIKILL